MERNNQKKHFVLIHGACHGAWCWYKLETLLTSAGHSVTSLDLAASGINPKQVEDLHSIADYYEPLMAFMASLPQDEKVILVGHSYNGLSISVAMEKFPEKISVAVFISAIMPSPTNSVVKIEEEDLALATKLVRPIGFFGNQDMLKETAVSDRKYGSVSRVFILCDEEDDIKESLKGMIAKYPPDEVKEIPGSDHMVMISKPQELCTYLQEIANRYS
ncbi:polyneuridine-aldehyde esterase-like isoform X3 [Telopea speciosissima]|uniref:polyneuridine-aldehyde esterase-like isoform X3 n=1 Tax=Telopea speciosissima TaxID=54955 RepID=UPI001CC4C022|nr:polyneuridine-aldehyde esterase-like isoform X3 [Telopea speciosissima]